MSLRSRVVLFLGLAFFLLFCFQYALLHHVVLPEFFSLERNEAEHDLKRVVKAIERETIHLKTFCWDWASWDDTYDFMSSRSEAYIDSNLVKNSFKDNRLNLIYYVDVFGKVVWGEIYDLDSEKEITVKEFSSKTFSNPHPLMPSDQKQYALESANVSGLLMCERGAMLIASCPILTSDSKGPARGFLIMGRFLTKEVLNDLQQQTQIVFDILSVRTPGIGDSIRMIRSQTSSDASSVIHRRGKDMMACEILQDIEGKDVFLVKAEIPARTSESMLMTSRIGSISMSLSALSILLLVLLFLGRKVLNPIDELTQYAKSVGETGHPDKLLPEDRNDEIGILIKEFNRMVVSLENRSNELAEVNIKLANDIEKRKSVEHALSESEKLYRSFISNFQGIAYQGTADLKPIFLHGDVGKITGYSHKKFLQNSIDWGALIHGDDLAELLKDIDSLRSIPEFVKERTIQLNHKDGKPRWVQLFVQNVCDDSGIPAYIQGVVYDISKIKLMEKQLLQAMKFEAIGTLAGGIAHDFNNTLMSIRMNIEFALMKLKERTDIQEILDTSLEASSRAQRLVEQLLYFSRKGESENPIAINMPLFIQESIRMLQTSLPSSIVVKQKIDPGSGEIFASPVKMYQVLSNLFSNAIEAMSEKGGVLTVNLDADRFVFDPPDHETSMERECIKLSVSDTGVGIPKGIQDRIFDPFVTTKNPGEGSGMGLSVVYGIIGELGGIVRMTSNEEKGSTFEVVIPRTNMMYEVDRK